MRHYRLFSFQKHYFILLAPSFQDEIFIDYIIGDLSTNNYANRLLISFGEIDHDNVKDLQRFSMNHHQNG